MSAIECINCKWNDSMGMSHDEYVTANRVMAWLCVNPDGTVFAPRSPEAEPVIDENGTCVGYTTGA